RRLSTRGVSRRRSDRRRPSRRGSTRSWKRPSAPIPSSGCGCITGGDWTSAKRKRPDRSRGGRSSKLFRTKLVLLLGLGLRCLGLRLGLLLAVLLHGRLLGLLGLLLGRGALVRRLRRLGLGFLGLRRGGRLVGGGLRLVGERGTER